jgi:endonuclease G, mitochondrial
MTVVPNEPLRVPHVGARAARVAAAPQDAWRTDSVDRKRAYAKRRGLDVTKLRTSGQLDRALEKVVGNPDFLPGRWIRRARAAAEAVGRVKRADGAFGTGFLVSPWLMMTNHHVLETEDTAAEATVTFRYEEDDNDELQGTVRLALQPERCFVTSPVVDGLDMTLVAVAPTSDGLAPGAAFGCIPAQGLTGKVLVGEPVNIVQHPDGRPRQIAIRYNLLLSVDDAVSLTYSTDTLPGSSGAPVLSDRWELVALHHSSRTIKEVVANVGIRTSAIVAHVRALTEDPDAVASAGSDAAELLEEFLKLGDTPT